MPARHRISVHSPAAAAAVSVVGEGLHEYNIAGAPFGDVQPLHVLAEDEDDSIIGGAIGRTWGECCELQQLWVSAPARGAGIGSQLMDAFEQNAVRRGCLLVYLDTFSFQAPDFYVARGYEEVHRTAGFTGGVVKITMQMRLPSRRAEA
jgi:GNAT superfamily N-acetyltransferase